MALILRNSRRGCRGGVANSVMGAFGFYEGLLVLWRKANNSKFYCNAPSCRFRGPRRRTAMVGCWRERPRSAEVVSIVMGVGAIEPAAQFHGRVVVGVGHALHAQ